MGEDLKLFGEVGLGYAQLQKDAEQINKLLNDIDKNAKLLGDTFRKNNIDPNTAKTVQDYQKLYNQLIQTKGGSEVAGRAMLSLAQDVNELSSAVKRGEESISKATASMSKMDLGSSEIQKQAKAIAESIRTQRKELKQWAKEKSSIAKDLSTKEISQMVLDDYKNVGKGSSTVEKAEAFRRMGQAMSVVNYEMQKNQATIKSLSEDYERAKNSVQSFIIEQDKIGKSVSKNYFLEAQNLAKDPSTQIGYQEKFLKNGAISVMTKYRNDAQNEIKKLFHVMQDGSIKLISATETTGKKSVDSIRKQISSIKQETKGLETQARKLDKALNFFDTDKATKGTGKSLGLLLGQAYAIKRAVGYINKEIMEFERNAVEIQRIAGYTKEEMDDLAKSTFDMGKNMGLNVHTIQEIEGLWARAGKGGKELVEATRTTALGFNVAEFKDAESAVASMNSIINQMYNGDATKAPEILDALTKVADKTAVRNVNDLVEVVSRAGANAKSLHMNLHELNAVSSIVMERMKTTGDVLGTQLKTIFAYMADGKRIDKLKKYGVEFTNIGKDGTESLKPFMEMMDNLVAKYNELKKQGKDVMANNMIKELSGVRNVATLKNLVEGWGSQRERVLLSENSKGFAERQNAKMMETYAKKVEQLKVSFQELAVAIGNNGLLDALKHIADGTKTGVEFISKYNKQILLLIGTIGTFKVTMHGIEGLLKIFGNNGLMGMFKIMTDSTRSKGFRTRFALSALSGTEFLMKKGMQEQVWEGVAKGAGEAVSPVKTLTGAMGSLKAQVVTMTAEMGVAVPVIGAVGVALAGLLLKMYVDKQKRLAILDDFTSGRADEAIGNIRELKKELDQITNTDAYRRGDANALDSYKSTTEELAKLLGVTNSVIIGNKSSMDTYNRSLKLAVDLKEKEYELNKKIANSEARTRIENMAKHTVRYSGDINDSEMSRAVKSYRNYLKQVQKIQKEITDGDNSERMKTKLDKATQNYYNAEVNLTKKIQEVKTNQAQAGMSDDEINKLFAERLEDGTSVVDVMDEIIARASDTKDGLGKVGEGAKNAKNETDQLKESIDQLLDKFDTLSGQSDIIGKAFNEINETGVMDNGTVMKLLKADPEIASYIAKTKDGYTLLAGAVDHYKEIQAETNQTVEEAINKEREHQNLTTDLNGNPLIKDIKPTELKQSLDEMTNSIQESMDKAQVSFENGKTNVQDFFNKIKTAKNDADLSNLLSGIDTSQIEALNGALANDLTSSLQQLNEKFNSGIIDIGEYANALNATQAEALNLYTHINNLEKNDNGVWVNKAGEVDKFANALQNSVTKIDTAKDSYNRLMDAIKSNPMIALVFSDKDLDVPKEQLEAFADDFTKIMQTTKDKNKETWDAIVSEISEQTGISKTEVEKCLTNTNDFVKMQDSAVKTAIIVSTSRLGESMGLTEAQVAQSARRISRTLSSLLNTAMSQLSAINTAMGGSAVKVQMSNYKKIPKTTAGDLLYTFGGVDPKLLGNENKLPTKSGRLVTVDDASISLDKQITEYAERQQKAKAKAEAAKKAQETFYSQIEELKKGDKRIGDTLNKFGDDTTKTPRRNGGGSKSSTDVPKVVEDKLEDLRHELEMGRISEEQFYKGVEKLYSKNSGKMSKRGKQKFEKMIQDAKKKADSSIPPYAKVLIDDLEDQLKYGEIDQYTYSSKLDDIARRYKDRLGKKAVKEIEKKISDAKIGGLDKYFKDQIDEFENIIKVSDLAVKKIQAEQSLYEALNMGDTAGMNLQATKINVINNKLYATEALAKKYESVLKVINEEIKKLDVNSNSYKTTLKGLVDKQDEFTNKLNETKIATIELQKARVEEQMKVYDAMQKQYDDAVSTIEQMESKLITFIQQRNQKIREQIDKNHKAKMDALDKETKARDKELEKEKKRLQDALEAYRKYTQGKIDSLDKQWEEEDYQKELDKKLKERDEIQQRIDSLSLDDTSTARGKRIELTQQLADKDNEIEEFQRDRSRKLTKEGLQKQLKDYEDSLEKKQKKLDDQNKEEQEDRDNRRKALDDEYKHELDILDEKMKASSMYAEAKQAILSGYVEDATGASIAIRDAMIQGMREQGQASGILAQKYIDDLDAVIRKAQQAKQVMGMMNSSAGSGSLQAYLGLTDEGYQQYLGAKARDLGFTSLADTERYINNKRNWSSASASERKRFSDENHQLRAKYAGDPKNWNNKSHNRDINGAVLGHAWINDTGSAMKVGHSFGQHTPLGGGFSRDEARATAQADLGLYNSYSRGSSEAFFVNQMNQFKSMGYPYSRPNLSSWTTPDYYKRWQDQSSILNRFEKTPMDMTDYAGAMGYIRNYKNELQRNGEYTGDVPNGGDNDAREALMASAKAQDGLPYSQGANRYTTHRDCSSYVYYAVKNAGLYGGDGFYTGDMIPKLAQYGWQDLGHIPKEQIKRGDILWIRDGKRNHTEIATQDGTLNSTGAHSAGKPAGPSVWGYDYRILRHPKVNGYSQGGIADYTGVAMLHGSKSSPEYIFNTPQFDALGRVIANYISAPTVYGKGVYNGSASSLPEINIDTLINIEGNADQSTVRELERQSNDILDKLVIGLKKRGIRR